MFDSSLITYAVSLHFSQKVNEIVISTLQAIADETGSSYRRACSLPVFTIFGIEEIRIEQIISAKPYSQHSLLFRWKLLLR